MKNLKKAAVCLVLSTCFISNNRILEAAPFIVLTVLFLLKNEKRLLEKCIKDLD